MKNDKNKVWCLFLQRLRTTKIQNKAFKFATAGMLLWMFYFWLILKNIFTEYDGNNRCAYCIYIYIYYYNRALSEMYIVVL